MKTILFVCTGNTCRSSIAEVLCKDLIEKAGEDLGDIKVISAGTSAMKGDKASYASKEIIREKGLSLDDHEARALTKDLIDEADLVLTMTTNHKHAVLNMAPQAENKVYTLKEYANDGENLEDVLDEMNEVYRKISTKKQRFMLENQKKLKELKEKRDALVRELKSVEREVEKLEKDFQEEITDCEDQLIFLKTKLPEMDIVDPFGQPIDAYRRSAVEIEESLKKLLKKLLKK
ncbi:protein-tyrosine phosphatase [Natronincola peptidivorans]|uniref:Protein-tyrosine phosphatase n=1 Tax=Natronincola peptidivorans TaxID=426128 RepID=A0A1H9ZLT9_9FIRM|nr:low molecular weight protein arginine phosphatase [Natronincola peptidivorans]SES82590.1 protein-tyrosine phosphatase [Natronincola peptidivorans]